MLAWSSDVEIYTLYFLLYHKNVIILATLTKARFLFNNHSFMMFQTVQHGNLFSILLLPVFKYVIQYAILIQKMHGKFLRDLEWCCIYLISPDINKIHLGLTSWWVFVGSHSNVKQTRKSNRIYSIKQQK